MFAHGYVVYRIVIEYLNIEVHRRFSDFSWLREELTRLCPGVIIPGIPGQSMMNSMDPLMISKRKHVLKEFLNDILYSPIIRNQKAFIDFFVV